MYIECKYILQFAICTASMELFKPYSKEKANFFCLIKLLFIKVRCLINVNVSLDRLRLIFKGKGGKQHCLPSVGSNLGVEIFLKKETSEKHALK